MIAARGKGEGTRSALMKDWGRPSSQNCRLWDRRGLLQFMNGGWRDGPHRAWFSGGHRTDVPGIYAIVSSPGAGARGCAGYVLCVKNGGLVCEYVYSDNVRYTITSEAPVPAGRHALRLVFTKTGERRGRGTLFIDGQSVGSIEIPKTFPIIAACAGVLCGRDAGSPVSESYACPFTFTGTIHRVAVGLKDDGPADPAAEYRSTLAEE